jgi:hypothetical protein
LGKKRRRARRNPSGPYEQLLLETQEGVSIAGDPPAPPAKVYFDESGIGGTQARFMTVGLLYNASPDAQQQVRKLFSKARRHWLSKQQRYLRVFKASSTSPKIRSRLLDGLAEIPGMLFVPATIEKRGQWESMETFAYSLLAMLGALVVQQLSGVAEVQIIWKPGPNKFLPRIFAAHYQDAAKLVPGPDGAALARTRITAVARELHDDVMLQVVDFFTNCAWRRAEWSHDADWERIKRTVIRQLTASISWG